MWSFTKNILASNGDSPCESKVRPREVLGWWSYCVGFAVEVPKVTKRSSRVMEHVLGFHHGCPSYNQKVFHRGEASDGFTTEITRWWGL